METNLVTEAHALNMDIEWKAKIYTLFCTKTDIFNFEETMALLAHLCVLIQREYNKRNLSLSLW
jgi:hypothetical protein